MAMWVQFCDVHAWTLELDCAKNVNNFRTLD